MKSSLFLIVVFNWLVATSVQDASADSETQAEAIVTAVKAKYAAYKSMESAFTLAIELPGEPAAKQVGTLIQQGAKYRLDMGGYQARSDGKTIWLYLKNNKEVQITHAETSQDQTLSPPSLLLFYTRDDYTYVLTSEYSEQGKTVQDLELKPRRRTSDYSKLRVTIEKSTSQIKRIRVFAKDGSRFTLTVNSFRSDRRYPARTFVWDKAMCPDCHVEDLRE